MSSTHPINRTTEWDDLQIKYGNYAPLPPEVKNEELSREAQNAAAMIDPLAGRSLKELDKLEDDIDEDVLEKYRRARLEELKAMKKKARFGSVREIGMADYTEEVTNASKEDDGQQVVICILYKDSVESSVQLCNIIAQIAKAHPEVKFCRGVSDKVVPNYRDSALPAILIYQNGVCTAQIVGTSKFGGTHKMNRSTVEWVLGHQHKLFKTQLDGNPFKDAMTIKRGGVKGAVARLARGQHGFDFDDDGSSNSSDEDEEEESAHQRHTVANDKGYGDLQIDQVAQMLR